jgi:ATP-binding cassette subfamily D (ALD) long-chain fatty acid import protein
MRPSRFQGLLVGGIFVHLPFLVRMTASEGDRVSAFRATEELMLRCGSAFTEVLFLGKSIDEARTSARALQSALAAR